MRILVTGSKGFIGSNLVAKLKENPEHSVFSFDRGDALEKLSELVKQVDVVFHLAGENRPKAVEDFSKVNFGLTKEIGSAIVKSRKDVRLILASSIQAESNNAYGESKRGAEQCLEEIAEKVSCSIYRLPNVFGKWCKPNYNSVVATFCHNIANNLSIQVNDASTRLQLVYVDDVVSEFLKVINSERETLFWGKVTPEYSITLGELADQIYAFKECRKTLVVEKVGVGLTRALYSTYISYLPPDQFSYEVPKYGDSRGVFVEMLKTPDYGQFSFFTAYPGVTRGSHYHHSKTEKFLVIEGQAKFRFRHIITNQTHEINTSGDIPEIVETIPGWTHDITNIGKEKMIVMLWANEIFDRKKPDTISCKV